MKRDKEVRRKRKIREAQAGFSGGEKILFLSQNPQTDLELFVFHFPIDIPFFPFKFD